jgi:hypothetical protein
MARDGDDEIQVDDDILYMTWGDQGLAYAYYIVVPRQLRKKCASGLYCTEELYTGPVTRNNVVCISPVHMGHLPEMLSQISLTCVLRHSVCYSHYTMGFR